MENYSKELFFYCLTSNFFCNLNLWGLTSVSLIPVRIRSNSTKINMPTVITVLN